LVGCNIEQLQKASNDPIQCSIVGTSVTLSNQKAYDPTTLTTGFNIKLSSVRNPNAGTYPGIRVFILETPTHASEYCPDLGAMTFTTAPNILYMPYLNSKSPNTRDQSEYQMDLLTSQSATFTSL
jgi:hypothetical protein